MTDIFDKYGECAVRLIDGNIFKIKKAKGDQQDAMFTLNELTEALEERLYPKFKERYDRERDGG